MQIFRTMEQPDSGDLRALPGYADLSDEARQVVAEQYKTVYAGCQRLGVRVAQGMAYEAAKRMCSDLLKEATEAPKPPQPPKKKKVNWKDQAYRDLGMNKVRGASGKTYYEGEKPTVKILGRTVTVGSKKHQTLVAQKKQFDDLGHHETKTSVKEDAVMEFVHNQAATQDPAHKRTSYHNTLEKHGFSYDHTQKDGKVKRHQWSHPKHGTVSSIHGEGPAEWFHAPHGGQTKANARSAEHLDHYLKHETK
jgi:hypothetical protein